MLSGLIYPRCQRLFPCLGARELSSRAARVSCEAARKVADQHFGIQGRVSDFTLIFCSFTK